MGSDSGVPPSTEIIWRATAGCLPTKLIRFPSGDHSTTKARTPKPITVLTGPYYSRRPTESNMALRNCNRRNTPTHRAKNGFYIERTGWFCIYCFRTVLLYSSLMSFPLF